MSTQDDERFLKEMFSAGWDLLKKHPGVLDKLTGYFKGSRDISPDEEREISALVEELKGDVTKGSRDLSSENVSPEDQQRWITAAIGAASTAYSLYKQHPGVVKSVWKTVSSWF